MACLQKGNRQWTVASAVISTNQKLFMDSFS